MFWFSEYSRAEDDNACPEYREYVEWFHLFLKEF